MEVLYRRITEEDILTQKNEVIGLLGLLFLQDEKTIKKYYDSMLEFCKDGSAILSGAFYKSMLIGFHWSYEINWGGEKRIHSYFMAVKKEYQNMSIGTKFQKILEEFALSKGIYTIDANCEADNEKSCRYHQKHGYEIESYRMIKRLKKRGEETS